MGLYLRKNSSVWWMRYTATGRAIDESTGTRDRRKAELVLKQRRAEVAQRKLAVRMGVPVETALVDPRLGFDEFFARVRERYVNAGGAELRASRENSWRGDGPWLRRVLDYFASKGLARVAAVTSRHVEAFRDWRLTTGVAAATVNHNIRVGRAAWNWAKRMGFVHSNPFDGVKPVKTARYDPRNLSEFELRKLFDAAARDRFLPVVATAVYAGLRLGELIALEWTDIDLGSGDEDGVIRIACDETFQTKSRKPRVVPLASELRALLLPLRRPTGLVFPSTSGGRLDAANLRKSILRIGARAGVTDFCPHDLRRTFASLLAARGVPTSRIRDYLGHASVATTEGYYVARGQVEARDVAKLRLGARPAGTPPAAEASATEGGRGDSVVESA